MHGTRRTHRTQRREGQGTTKKNEYKTIRTGLDTPCIPLRLCGSALYIQQQLQSLFAITIFFSHSFSPAFLSSFIILHIRVDFIPDNAISAMTPSAHPQKFASIRGTRTMNILRASLLLLTVAALSAGTAGAQQGTTDAHKDTITTASGLKYVMTHQGKGKKPKSGDLAVVHYTGTLLDGTVFDSSRDREPFAFRLGKKQVIQGWDEGIALLRAGDRATFIIPAKLAYGERNIASIPPNSTLVFDVELIDIKKKSVGDEITAALDAGNGKTAWNRYQQLKKSGFDDYYMSEGELNMVGYKYLQAAQIDQAITVFKINVDAFPESYNVYDSLGEAYMKKGEKALAIENYERSLALNPKNGNAAKMLEQLTVTR